MLNHQRVHPLWTSEICRSMPMGLRTCSGIKTCGTTWTPSWHTTGYPSALLGFALCCFFCSFPNGNLSIWGLLTSSWTEVGDDKHHVWRALSSSRTDLHTTHEESHASVSHQSMKQNHLWRQIAPSHLSRPNLKCVPPVMISVCIIMNKQVNHRSKWAMSHSYFTFLEGPSIKEHKDHNHWISRQVSRPWKKGVFETPWPFPCQSTSTSHIKQQLSGTMW